MNNKLLYPAEDYAIEDFEAVQKRYLGFGKDIYLKIKEQLPDVFDKMTFYQNLTYQKDHSYAIYENFENSFAIQLAPVSERIIFWNETKHIEIGFWSENEYEEAINYIRKELLSNNLTK